LIHIFEGKYALLNLLALKNLGLATEEPVVYNVNKKIGFCCNRQLSVKEEMASWT
jgi:hypothetical protein